VGHSHAVFLYTLQFELPARLPYNQRVSDGAANASINASTRYCAVLGHPIRHSASPAMQNAALAALNLNWRYLAFDVHPDNLAEAIAGAKAMGFIGLNLTVPHKLLALDLVDAVEARAKLWGAVNTIVFETRDAQDAWVPLASAGDAAIKEIRSHGFNTDADAIVQSLKEDFQWADMLGATVLLLGAGGAARSAALRLAEEDVAKIYLVNRTEEHARQLAANLTAHHPRLSVIHGYPRDSVDLVVNATSLGLKPNDPLPIDRAWLESFRPPRIYDMIYRPKETALLRAARAAGCRAANGLGMLLYQGAEALKLWSGAQPPLQIMRAALEKNIHE
jgi:shikimate dehydrogenase